MPWTGEPTEPGWYWWALPGGAVGLAWVFENERGWRIDTLDESRRAALTCGLSEMPEETLYQRVVRPAPPELT